MYAKETNSIIKYLAQFYLWKRIPIGSSFTAQDISFP